MHNFDRLYSTVTHHIKSTRKNTNLIIHNLQTLNSNCWTIKYFSECTLLSRKGCFCEEKIDLRIVSMFVANEKNI